MNFAEFLIGFHLIYCLLWLGLLLSPFMGCFEIYTFVLKKTTAPPLGISHGEEVPLPALCEPGALLGEGSCQGIFSNPFQTFVGCQSEAGGVMETLSPERKCEQNPALS